MPAVVHIAAVADAHEGVVSTPGHLRVSRTDDDLSQSLTVRYEVSGTATPGIDYQALLGSAVIPVGQASVEIAILPIDDDIPEFPESAIVSLLAGPGYDLGEASQAAVHITNQETVTLIAGTSLTFVVGYTVPDTTELPVLTAEVLPFGASFDIVHSEPHPPGAHTFGQFSWTPLLEQVGSHEVVFRVTVPGTDIDETSSLIIQVVPNFPPQVNVGGSSGTETDDQTQQFTWSAGDDVGLAFVSATVTQDGNPIFTSTDAAGSFNFDAYGLGNFAIAVTAIDTTGQTTTTSQSVTVSDDDTQGPIIVLGGSTGTESEAQLQEFTWDVTDASGLSSLEVVITQDNGSGSGPVEIFRTEDLDDVTGSFNFDSYGPGTFAISVNAVDGDNDWSGDGSQSFATRSVTVTAGNRPPAIHDSDLVLSATAIDENGVVTLSGTFTDPDSGDVHTVVIDWGDGSPAETLALAAGARSFGPISHTYLDDDPTGTTSDNYTIRVTVADATGSASASTAVAVNNVAPTVSDIETNWTEEEGGNVYLAGTISDPGTADTFLLTVDWGDGTAPQTFTYAAGTTQFRELHQYQSEIGEQVISFTLADDDGGQTAAQAVRGGFSGMEFTRNANSGDLDNKNPDGTGGTRDFGGGWRYFPDAVVTVTPTGGISGQNTARNILVIRAEFFDNTPEGTKVYFSSFDVDDPSNDLTAANERIADPRRFTDPNDGLVAGVLVPWANDNQGRLDKASAPTYDKPADSVESNANFKEGYQGLLRTVGGQFPVPEQPDDPEPPQLGGNIVMALVKVVDGKKIAEVELATSFAPGDNFRVAASFSESALKRLRARHLDPRQSRDQVPADNGLAMNDFAGALTPMLTVWRHLHIESDRMVQPAAADFAPGLTAGRSVLVNPLRNWWSTPVIVGRPGDKFADRQFDGGVLRLDNRGDNLRIVASFETNGARREHSIITVGRPIGGALRAVTLYEDDYEAEFGRNQPAPTLKIDPFEFTDAQIFSLMKASPNWQENRYADAFIQPEYAQLKPFNTAHRNIIPGAIDNPVPASKHFPSQVATPEWSNLIKDNYGSKATRSDLYWVAYVTTAYEGPELQDRDPNNEGGPGALSIGPVPGSGDGIGVTVIFTEPLREVAEELNDPSRDLAVVLARTAVHEIGHQFGLVPPDQGDFRGHRPGANIMDIHPFALTNSEFAFHSQDLASVRRTRKKA